MESDLTRNPLPVTESKQPSFLITLLSILLLISVFIAGFFAWKTQKLVKELQGIRNEELTRQTSTASPSPNFSPIETCKPRPVCLDSEPRCLIPETEDMCPPTTSVPDQRACTMEAKICPDGSAVGRSGPKCEFEACPTPTNNKN